MDQPQLGGQGITPPSHIPPHQRNQHPLANYQFSGEELRVLRECNTESFFQRSLPLGIGFGVAAYFGVQHGYLKGNMKYGAVPKVIVGVIAGYFLGKFSYQQKCAEKLMRLPESRLGEALRQRRQTGNFNITSDQSLGMGVTLSPFVPSGTDIYTDEHIRGSGGTLNPNSSLNLDVESRPTFSGLDDIYRPSLDSPNALQEPELPIEPAKQATTYDELRRKNRDEYLKKQQSPYSRPLPPDSPIVIRSPDAPTPAVPRSNYPDGLRVDQGSTATPHRNKYGDSWTD